MEMVVTNNGYLAKDGVTTRIIPEQKFQFKATVNPCVSTLANVEPLENMVYTLAEPAMS